MPKKKEVAEQKTETKQEKPRWQQQIDEFRAKKPIQADIALTEVQDCLVVKASVNGRPIKAFSLVWKRSENIEEENVYENNVIDVRLNRQAGEQKCQLYLDTMPGDIIQVRNSFVDEYYFVGNKTRENAIKDFIKSKLEKEVKVKDYKEAIEWMTKLRKAVQDFEYNTNQKVIGKY